MGVWVREAYGGSGCGGKDWVEWVQGCWCVGRVWVVCWEMLSERLGGVWMERK